MDRRNFLKQVSLWSAGILTTPPVFQLTPDLFASSSEKSVIKVATGVTYGVMVRKIIASMGGIDSIVKPGNKVVIKPNIGWDRNVDQAANTHPQIVAELATLCLDAGASMVSVFDRTCNEERRCYTNSGIKSALSEIKNKRLHLDYIDDRKFVPIKIKQGTKLSEWSFYRDALEADCYINVPVAKHHSLSRLSLGLKNVMGVIGGRRGKLHFNLGEKLADLNTVIKPDLTIVDATRVITKNGPQGGSLKYVKKLDTIVGSFDPVAVDAYATTLFGLRPEQIDAIVKANEKGLGQMDLDQCDIEYLKG